MSKSYRDDPELRHLFVRKCRGCGQEIDIKEYGPEKICPYCGKVSAPANIKQAHVVFRRNEYSDIGWYINGETNELELNVNYKKFLLSYVLDMGNISDPPKSNEHLHMHQFGSVEGCTVRIQREIAELEKLDADVEVYLWSHQNDANCYLNMLYFSPLFLRFNKVYLVTTYTKEDVENDNYFPGDSLKRKRLLSRSELEEMQAEFWRSFRGEYRIMRNGELLTYDEGELDGIVLGCIEKEFLFYNVIYSRMLECFKERENTFLPWDVFKEIMWRLLKLGLIESDGTCEQWGDRYISLIERNFRLAVPQTRSHTKRELLQILCNALAYGVTYPLYAVLAEDAYLEWDYGDGFENEGVVQRIEVVGGYLEHYKKEQIDCVLCTDEKENFDPDHLCLLWIGEWSEGKEFYAVHIDVEGDKIGKIAFSKPRSGASLYPIYDDEGE